VADRDHPDLFRRDDVLLRVVADVHHLVGGPAQAVQGVAVQLRVRLADAHLVRDEDGTRIEVLHHAEADQLLRLLDLQALRQDPEHQVRIPGESAERLLRVGERMQLAELRLVVGDDAGGHEESRIHTAERLPRQPPEQLVVVAVVVRLEFEDDFLELPERGLVVDVETHADHRLDGVAPRLLRKLRGGEQRVVDVEEDRLEGSGRHGGG